ncbi:MAG: hypothetical protein ABFD92_05730 [Planctomycetaceae bacterium]|nr:hypothetical protein [Planctomycetaceae bacterium]
MMAALFYNPVDLPWGLHVWLMLPLCLAVAIIYKTIRVKHLRQLPLAVVGLVCYIVLGLAALGAALAALHAWWP